MWVIIDTFKSDDIIRKHKKTILASWWDHTAIDWKVYLTLMMTSLWGTGRKYEIVLD